jgi:hypothetical protein
MSNKVKHNVFRTNAWVHGRDATRWRWELIGFVGGLLLLAAALGNPMSWWRVGTAGPVTDAPQAVDLVGGALLAAAGVVVWTLLGWSLLIAVAVGMSRLAGGPGRFGRATVARLAPRPILRMLTVAVGLSVVAGTSGCAALPMAAGAPPTASSEPAVAGQSEVQPSADTAVNIDWPAAPAAPSSAPRTLSPTDASTGSAADVPTGPAMTTATTPAPGERPSAAVTAGPDPTTATGTPVRAPSVNPGTSTSSTTPSLSVAAQPPVPVTAPSEVAHAAAPSPASATAVSVAPSDQPAASSRPPSNATTGTPLSAAQPVNAQLSNPAVLTAEGRPSAVTVRTGDTLWAIAQRALPAPATDDAIDAEWRAWYVTNAGVIGTDPDLIEPGQLLLAPHSKAG